jgi:hypothetical protein
MGTIMNIRPAPLGTIFTIIGDTPGRRYRVLYNFRTGCFCTWICRRDTGRWTQLNGKAPLETW